MEKEVLDYIRKNEMVKEGEIVLAGVSGGSDSMAMLYILKQLQKEIGFSLRAVHVHHGIRGQEADRDCSFVENICKEWEIPCSVYRYDVPKLSREWKLGEEETGRNVRKEAFRKEREKCEGVVGVKTALAHNQEDLAETMLHNLCRGTGVRGLCTMRPSSEEIIRPVLCLSRVQIAAYLKENQIPHIFDSTNQSEAYTRNRIRHHILPLLEKEINEKAASHMVETAARLAQAEDYLTLQGTELLQRFQSVQGYLFTADFFAQPQILQTYTLQAAMETLAGRRKDLTAVHYEKVLALWQMQTGKRISLPYQMEAARNYKGVWLGQQTKKASGGYEECREWKLPVPGELDCSLGEFQTEIFLYDGQKIEEKTYTKWLDYDKIKKDLCVRTRRNGDYLVINDKGNTKKINRCMIDEKILAEKREHIPLIACEDEILWMVGGRINARYKISPDTKKVLVLHYQGGYKNE